MRSHNRIINFEVTRRHIWTIIRTERGYCLVMSFSITPPPAECQSKIRPYMAHTQKSMHVTHIFRFYFLLIFRSRSVLLLSRFQFRQNELVRFWGKKLNHPNSVCGILEWQTKIKKRITHDTTVSPRSSSYSMKTSKKCFIFVQILAIIVHDTRDAHVFF